MSKDRSIKQTQIWLTLPPKILAGLEEQAAADGLKRGEWIRHLIEKEISRRGRKRRIK